MISDSLLPRFVRRLTSPVHPAYLPLHVVALEYFLLARKLSSPATRSDFEAHLERMLSTGVFQEIHSPMEMFLVSGKSDVDELDIVCAADPLGYISHLSAMDFHGLTDRRSRSIYFTTLAPKLWRQEATRRFRAALGPYADEYDTTGLPRPRQPHLERVNRRPVNTYSTGRFGGYKRVDGRGVRVSKIGRTFLDMVRRPDLCGGIRHVEEVYLEHGPRFQALMEAELDRNGTGVERARAGYFLQERCELDSPVLDAWAARVQRGGSRKLDPGAPFDGEHYSERWALSVNV